MLQLQIKKPDKTGKERVVKTYKREEYKVKFGLLEDISKFEGLTSNEDILRNLPIFKPILKDIFFGLTDEEIRLVDLEDIVKVVSEVFEYMGKNLGDGAKN